MNDLEESYYPLDRFELYNLARKFRQKVYKLIKQLPPEEKYCLDSQMRDAIISVIFLKQNLSHSILETSLQLPLP